MKKSILFVALCCVISVSYAKVEVKGDNKQTTNIKNSGIANSSVGMGSEAKMNLNSVTGNAKLGSNNQTLSVENAGIANSAVGMGSKSTMNIGTVSGD